MVQKILHRFAGSKGAEARLLNLSNDDTMLGFLYVLRHLERRLESEMSRAMLAILTQYFDREVEFTELEFHRIACVFL